MESCCLCLTALNSLLAMKHHHYGGEYASLQKRQWVRPLNSITETSLLSSYELKIPVWKAFIMLMKFHNYVQ